MEKILILFRSITFAQKGERVLNRVGIDCRLLRTPRTLSNKSCGYCLQLRRQDLELVLEVLREAKLPFGKVYAIDSGGAFKELLV